ncbi:hypothetical protein ACE0DR_25950 [Azotobacter sp. CWF10]
MEHALKLRDKRFVGGLLEGRDEAWCRMFPCAIPPAACARRRRCRWRAPDYQQPGDRVRPGR